MVAVVNGKILLSQLTCGKYWLPMTFTEALPPLHHAWDLLAQLGLDSLVGQLTFLGTQVQTLGHNTKLVTKCYGLTARTARQPTLANGRQLTWISPDRFFRLIAGVTLGMPKISQYLSLGKHSANYIALGLDTGKSQKNQPKRKAQQVHARANHGRAKILRKSPPARTHLVMRC